MLSFSLLKKLLCKSPVPQSLWNFVFPAVKISLKKKCFYLFKAATSNELVNNQKLKIKIYIIEKVVETKSRAQRTDTHVQDMHVSEMSFPTRECAPGIKYNKYIFNQEQRAVRKWDTDMKVNKVLSVNMKAKVQLLMPVYKFMGCKQRSLLHNCREGVCVSAGCVKCLWTLKQWFSNWPWIHFCC